MKLTPCPYCGTEPEALHIFDGEEIVRCPNQDHCPVMPSVAMNTARDAAYFWNERMAALDRIEKLEATRIQNAVLVKSRFADGLYINGELKAAGGFYGIAAEDILTALGIEFEELEFEESEYAPTCEDAIPKSLYEASLVQWDEEIKDWKKWP